MNADTIAAGLSAFSPESVALAAGRITLDRVHELARERRDFAFETTLASRTFAPWLKRLQADGYTFHLVYLCLPAVGMSVERVAEPKGFGWSDGKSLQCRAVEFFGAIWSNRYVQKLS